MWPLWGAGDLDTGAGDWPAHAFRVEEIARHGIASWSHSWAGGMPVWEGYQALPHVVTLGVQRASGIETTRAMVLLAALLLVAMRATMYLALRWAGASPAAAAAGALAAAALDVLTQPVANYSELWGLALAPLLLYAGYRQAGRAGGFVVAAAVGIALEVHPLLAVAGAIGLGAGYLAWPRERSVRLLLCQGVLAAAGGAVFWLPVIASARPAYSEPYFGSAEFARTLFDLATRGFVPGWPAAVVAAGAACAIAAWRWRVPAARFLLLVGATVAGLIAISVADRGPELVREAQLARLVSLGPLLIGAALAIALSGLARDTRSGWAAWPVAGLLGVLVLAHGWQGPTPVSDSASTAGAAVPDRQGRRWADPLSTARLSLLSGGAIQFAGSYSGREWSILHGPLEFFMSGNGSEENRRAYLLAHAIQPPDGGGERAAPPAWHLPRRGREGLTVPDLRFRDVESSYIRDQLVGRYATASVSSEAIPAAVRYRSGTTIEVDASRLDGDRYLVVNENWDRTWRATAGGRELPVERFGPNHIGVDLAGLHGEVTVRLAHSWPREAGVGLALSLAALPVGAAAAYATGRWQRRTRARMEGAGDEAGGAVLDGDP